MKEEKRVIPQKRTDILISTLSARAVFDGVLTAFCVFVFGRGQAVMQTYPLGLSLFCALNRNVIPGAVGLLLSALVTDNFSTAHMTGYIFGILFRIGVKLLITDGKRTLFGKYTDSIATRLGTGIISTLTISLIRIISGGFLYYDLLAALFYINCTALLTWTYTLATDKKYRYSAKFDTGIYALLFSSVLSLRGLSFLGLSLSTVSAFFITFVISRKKGAAQGSVIGLLTGAALGMEACPLMGGIGLLSGALSALPSYLGIMISAGAGIIGFSMWGGVELLATYLPEASAAVAIFIPLSVMGLLNLPSANTAAKESVIPIPSPPDNTRRLCDSLIYLSEMFGQLAKKQNRPAVHEITDLLCNTFAENCKGCTQKSVCFGKFKISQSPKLRIMAESIYSKGICTSCDLTEEIRQSCYFKDKLTAKINIALSHLNEEKTKFGKLEVMESDYACMAELIAAAVSSEPSEYSINSELTEKLKREPMFRRIFGDCITVYGQRRICIIGAYRTENASLLGTAELKQCLESFVGCGLNSPDHITDGARTIVKYESRPKYMINGEKHLVTKHGEKHNGDSADMFCTDEGYYYSIVCDGMGSGDGAALTSGTSAVFLKTLLSSGCEKETVMKCLNNFVAAKGSECFTTADLLSIDTYTGKCSFVKCGACASLVVRGDNIYKLSSHTPPVGIMKELCAEKLDFQLKHGDTVVMMSDGVWDWVKEPTWLYELLTLDRKSMSADKLCREITSRAQSEGDDDVSICLLEISEF